MAEKTSPTETAKPAAESAVSGKASETLSQFIARVLTQLSLSAWLPSAALVLSLAFVIHLGTVLDNPRRTDAVWPAITSALQAMGAIKVGGALLLFIAVVVLTIFTQAFSYEAIRVLEGYWGTGRPLRWYARWRCDRFESRAARLRRTYKQLTAAAWDDAEAEINHQQRKAIDSGMLDKDLLSWTPNMLAWLGGQLKGQRTVVDIGADRAAALDIPWQRFAHPDFFRRQVNIDKKSRDYPRAGRCLPTRFGNVMRAHEDATGRSPVETFVLDLYDSLPVTLRVQHDEWRNRLDLYASMIYVEVLVTAVAILRLVQNHAAYALGAALVGLALVWLTYRAAVASARLYGTFIVNIAQRFPPPA
jgi:hypothetical protein